MPEKNESGFAVIDVAGKQYRVKVGQEFKVPVTAGEAGQRVKLEQVLLLNDGSSTRFGNPTVAGATVDATLLQHGRDEKVTVFKFRRRKGYRRKTGHRQGYSILRVDGINLAAPKPPAAAASKAGPPAKDKAAPKPKAPAEPEQQARPKPKAAAAPKKPATKKAPASGKSATAQKSKATGTAAPKKTGTAKKASGTRKSAATKPGTVKKAADTKKSATTKTVARKKTGGS